MTDSPASSSGRTTRGRDEDDGLSLAGSGEGGGASKPTRKRKRNDGDRKHLCDWEDCGKSFSRVDHLTRHALNHTRKEIFSCDRCSKIFVRQDLLVRHVERHVKRESVAADGGSLRPMPRPAVAVAESMSQPSPSRPPAPLPAFPYAPQAGETWHDQQGLQQSFFSFDPQSPASQRRAAAQPSGEVRVDDASTTSHFAGRVAQQGSSASPVYASALVIPSFRPDPPSPFDPSLNAPFYGDHPGSAHSHAHSQSSSSHLGVDEPLNFIQASYGAPFVSASEYDWLFDATRNFDVTLASSRPASPGHENYELDFGMGLSSNANPFDFAAGGGIDASAFDTPIAQKWAEHDDEVDQAGKSDGMIEQPRPASVVPEEPEELVETTETPSEDRLDPSTFIKPETRLRILDYLGPEWIGLRGDERMSTTALEEYLSLFWHRVHETQAPGVHRASFKTDTAPTPLLLSMMLLGCYFADKEAHVLATKIHPMFRGKVFCSPDFRPRAELWVHQTALLIIVFGKLCSNRIAHEMSHIFWSSVVTLARRSGLLSQRLVAVPPESRDDVEVLWAAWIEEEVAKRVAHIDFATDVQHAALFRHSPALSAFQVQLTLPCDEDEWDAPTAEEWFAIHKAARPPIPFISALKASLMAGATPPVLNAFSRITILHGLISVAQDLQWRDHVIGLSQPEGRQINWRDLCSAAYNSWKARLDLTLQTATFPTSQLLRASISLYAVAHISLSVDVHEIQIFAGAENALGLVVSPVVYEATTHRIRIWAASKDGRSATWHAAFFLRSSLQHWFESTGDLAGCLHHRWAVYIAALTLYCFGKATSGPPGPRAVNHREETMRYLDSMCTNSPEGLLAVPFKNNTASLCETICEYIQGSRWEIAQEGARILARLLPDVAA